MAIRPGGPARVASPPNGLGRAAFVLCLLPPLAAVVVVARAAPLPAAPGAVPLVVAALLAGGAGWIAAVELARRGFGDARWVLCGAIALRLVAGAHEPGLSDDLDRYVWEGRLVLAGQSPYARPPSDPVLAPHAARAPGLHARVAHPDVPAAYPPLAQGAFAAGIAVTRAPATARGEPLPNAGAAASGAIEAPGESTGESTVESTGESAAESSGKSRGEAAWDEGAAARPPGSPGSRGDEAGVEQAVAAPGRAGAAEAQGAAADVERGSGSHAPFPAAEERDALRRLFALCDLALLWPLARLLARRGLPVALIVVWGWSPLVAVEFAGSGHLDSLGILLLVAALAAEERGRRIAAELALAAAVLVKYLPLVALPYLARVAARRAAGERGAGARFGPVPAQPGGLASAEGPGAGARLDRRSIARTARVGALVLAGFAPVLLLREGDVGLFVGLAQYGLRWEGGSLVFAPLEAALASLPLPAGATAAALARGLCGLVWILVALRLLRREPDAVAATGAAIGALVVLSPVLHPWYLAWVLPFVALRPRVSWLLLVAGAPLLYLPLEGWLRERAWSAPAWAWAALALPFLVARALEERLERTATARRGRALPP